MCSECKVWKARWKEMRRDNEALLKEIAKLRAQKIKKAVVRRGRFEWRP